MPAIEAARPLDPTARPLHRGHPGEGARGARHRAAVDLRVDDADDPGPRLRVEEGPGARADDAGVRRGAAARGPLHRPRPVRLHGAHGGRPRRDRRSPPGARALAPQVLVRQRHAGAGDAEGARPRRGRSRRREHRRRVRGRRRQGRAPQRQVRPVPAQGRRHPVDPHRSPARRAHRGPGAGAAERAEGRRPHRHRPRHRPARVRQERALRPLRPAGDAGRAAAGRAEAEDGLAVRRPVARDDHRRRGARAAVVAPGRRPAPRRRRRGDRRQRPLRPVPEVGRRDPVPRVGAPAVHR